MISFEVEQPILNSLYEEPAEHWWIEEGRSPERRRGRGRRATSTATRARRTRRRAPAARRRGPLS